jgi:hypothetical protein
MTTDNFCVYLQNRLIQTSQTGGQWYSKPSPLYYSLVKPTTTDQSMIVPVKWFSTKWRRAFRTTGDKVHLLHKTSLTTLEPAVQLIFVSCSVQQNGLA